MTYSYIISKTSAGLIAVVQDGTCGRILNPRFDLVRHSFNGGFGFGFEFGYSSPELLQLSLAILCHHFEDDENAHLFDSFIDSPKGMRVNESLPIFLHKEYESKVILNIPINVNKWETTSDLINYFAINLLMPKQISA